MTAHQFGNSLTGAVVRLAIVILTHIGTRVCEGSCALTVTATEYIVDDVVTQNSHFRSRHSSSITTAIYIFYTCQVTTFNQHFCIILCIIQRCLRRRIHRYVVCLVTTAIDSSNVVGCT